MRLNDHDGVAVRHENSSAGASREACSRFPGAAQRGAMRRRPGTVANSEPGAVRLRLSPSICSKITAPKPLRVAFPCPFLLSGLLVVALEQAVAAPMCTCRLADAGARVIKIERPEGDFARGYDKLARPRGTCRRE